MYQLQQSKEKILTQKSNTNQSEISDLNLMFLLEERFQVLDSCQAVETVIVELRRLMHTYIETNLATRIAEETNWLMDDSQNNFQVFLEKTRLRPYNHQKMRIFLESMQEKIQKLDLSSLVKIFKFLDEFNLYMGGIVIDKLYREINVLRIILKARLKQEKELDSTVAIDSYLLRIANRMDSSFPPQADRSLE